MVNDIKKFLYFDRDIFLFRQGFESIQHKANDKLGFHNMILRVVTIYITEYMGALKRLNLGFMAVEVDDILFSIPDCQFSQHLLDL